MACYPKGRWLDYRRKYHLGENADSHTCDHPRTARMSKREAFKRSVAWGAAAFAALYAFFAFAHADLLWLFRLQGLGYGHGDAMFFRGIYLAVLLVVDFFGAKFARIEIDAKPRPAPCKKRPALDAS